MADPSTSRVSASQISFSQMDKNLVHIAEDLESEPHYHLRKKIRLSENIKETFNESKIEMQVPEDTDDIDPENTDDINSEDANDIDSKDLQEASLNDALNTIKGKNVPKRIAEWQNVAYYNFLELIVEGNISNKMGDKIINFFNKYSNLEKSPLPSSTKKEVANNFVYKESLKKINYGKDEIRVFGKPYKGNWWLEMEASLPLLNWLLSIILYLDVIIFDGLNKTLGHPVFLTFDMLKANDVTAIYKGAKCKMLCYSCMVLQSDLNNMSLGLEDMASRTHENMQQIISDGQEKKYSVHSVKNAFWKFL
ncbi:hypothetical protein C1646_784750 [Rhizophagus diaphanus]|nr:hypothetical protein C1646_784750 [Rhizophagus diaphanus] [Rhizophagus sp. MUCL 43196]